MSGQMTIPGMEISAPAVGEIKEVRLEDVVGMGGVAPTITLVKSMGTYGLLVPIVVRAAEPASYGQYVVIAGRRRVAAARQLGWATIRALVVEGPTSPHALGLIENGLRSANPAAELAMIEAMLADGLTEGQVSAATGMAVGTIRKRLKLCRLIPALRAAFDQGAIATGVASAAAGLGRDAQERLAGTLEERGKLTASDVHDAQTARREATQADLFEGLDEEGAQTLPEEQETFAQAVWLDDTMSWESKARWLWESCQHYERTIAELRHRLTEGEWRADE